MGNGGSTPITCTAPSGNVATSGLTHELPTDDLIVTKVAFGSCYKPGSQTNDALWKHMRETFEPDVWNWLGDNIYGDTGDMDVMRGKYNTAKEDPYYSTFGPVAEPKIPVRIHCALYTTSSSTVLSDLHCIMPSDTHFSLSILLTDHRHMGWYAQETPFV